MKKNILFLCAFFLCATTLSASVDHTVDIPSAMKTEWFQAVRSLDYVAMEVYFKQYPNIVDCVNTGNPNGTALHIIVSTMITSEVNQVEPIMWLLERGADPKILGQFGYHSAWSESCKPCQNKDMAFALFKQVEQYGTREEIARNRDSILREAREEVEQESQNSGGHRQEAATTPAPNPPPTKVVTSVSHWSVNRFIAPTPSWKKIGGVVLVGVALWKRKVIFRATKSLWKPALKMGSSAFKLLSKQIEQSNCPCR